MIFKIEKRFLMCIAIQIPHNQDISIIVVIAVQALGQKIHQLLHISHSDGIGGSATRTIFCLKMIHTDYKTLIGSQFSESLDVLTLTIN